MQKAIFFIFTGLATCQGAFAADDNPVVGDWEWNPTRGQCREMHSYRADGSATTRSGEEILEKTYAITKVSAGTYRLDMKVVASNGGKDCLGSTTAVDATATTYVMLLNDGGYFTCASEDGMSCYGSARRHSPE